MSYSKPYAGVALNDPDLERRSQEILRALYFFATPFSAASQAAPDEETRRAVDRQYAASMVPTLKILNNGLATAANRATDLRGSEAAEEIIGLNEQDIFRRTAQRSYAPPAAWMARVPHQLGEYMQTALVMFWRLDNAAGDVIGQRLASDAIDGLQQPDLCTLDRLLGTHVMNAGRQLDGRYYLDVPLDFPLARFDAMFNAIPEATREYDRNLKPSHLRVVLPEDMGMGRLKVESRGIGPNGQPDFGMNIQELSAKEEAALALHLALRGITPVYGQNGFEEGNPRCLLMSGYQAAHFAAEIELVQADMPFGPLPHRADARPRAGTAPAALNRA